MSNQIGGSRINGLLPAQIGEFRRSMSGGAFMPGSSIPSPMVQPFMPGTSLPGMSPYMDQPFMPGTSLPGMSPYMDQPFMPGNSMPPQPDINRKPYNNKSANDKVLKDKSANNKSTNDKSANNKLTNDKSANNKSANDKVLKDISANNKSANKVANNKSANDKVLKDISANNKTASNNNTDSIIKILQDELSKQSHELYGIKLNNKNVPLWILLLLSNILIIWSFIVTPIRYSNVKIVESNSKETTSTLDKETSIFSYNKIYYYLHMILLLILFMYGYSLSPRIPLIENNPSYTTIGLVATIVIGVFIINISTSKPIVENGSYHSAPSHIYKSKKKMVTVHVLLVLLISTIIGYEIYKNPKNPLGLDRNLMGSSLVLALIGSIYLLINSIKYYVNKYNLPETWRR